MKKRIFSAVLACATAAALSLGAHATTASTAKPDSEAVQEVELNYIHTDIEENYIKRYNLYEQVMYGQIVFYTNISNGDIVSKGVKVELPAELETIFERDGKEIEFVNNEEITEIGSYSLTVIAKGEDILGGKENDRYYGLFRFRILEDDGYSVDPDEDYTEGDTIHIEDLGGEETDVSEGPVTDDTYEAPDDAVPSESEESTESIESTESDDPWADDSAEDSQPDEKPDDEPADDTESGADSGGDAGSDDPDGGDDDNAAAEDDSEAPEGDRSLIRAVGTDDGIKLVTKAKTEFFTNIPPDMKTTGDVTISTAADVQYKLYRNGKLVEDYDLRDEISKEGSYQFFVYDGSGTYPAEFDFEIGRRYVAGLTKYEAAKGVRIINALYEGNKIRSTPFAVELGNDGTYTIEMSYGDHEWKETFVLDNTLPDVGFKGVKGGRSPGGPVEIRLKSDDIESYEVYLDGKKIKVKKLTLTEPGEYVVKVYDRAGNLTEKNFIIEYRMNEMGIIVIVLLCAIVVAGVVFFIRCKKKFIVR